jgi:serine/threonine protein kinase/tetratricopeptide (TPR) repeat protein
MMNAPEPRWERIKEIFELVLDTPPERRMAALDNLCSDDVSVRSEVEWLLRQHEQAGTFLEEPLIALERANFAVGETLAERFRIIRLIGRGGMGEVYAAEDLELHELVAVKALRAEIALDAWALARFRHEFRSARRITHPNVCRVFDLERHCSSDGGWTLLLTMELLEGETLAERLKRRRTLPPKEALLVARGIARGLAAVHASGVLHRDLKPSNVMLVAEGGFERVVVTDFGIARPPRGERDVTRTRSLMGTPGYMAPEVLEGGEPTAASDVFSLGVVLHEMLIGERPAGAPRLEQAGREWRGVLRKCLEADRQLRLQSGAEVGAALDDLPDPGRRATVRRVAGVSLALTAIIVALFIFFSRLPRQQHGISPGAAVIISPIQNSTGDATLNGISDLVTRQAAQSARVNVWDSANLPAALQRMRRTELDANGWRELALRERAALVVFGSLGRVGDRYTLNLRAESSARTSSGAPRAWDHTATCRNRAALLDCVSDAGRWVREVSGESPAEIGAEDRTPQDITTGSWEALELYREANRLYGLGRRLEAVATLEECLVKDPEFALAQSRLGDVLFSLRRDAEGFQHWKAALDETAHQRLSRREELAIRSQYQMDIGDENSAEGPLLEWRRRFPYDPRPLFHLSTVYRAQGRYPEALASARQMEALGGEERLVWSAIARSSLFLKDYSQTELAANRLRLAGEPELADYFFGVSRFLTSDFPAAQRAFQRIAQSSNGVNASWGSSVLAAFLGERSQWEAASAVLEVGILADQQSGRSAPAAIKLTRRAFLVWRAGHSPLARALALEAIAREDSPDVLLSAGTLLARMGLPMDAAKALRRFDRRLTGPRFQACRLRLKGEIALARAQNSSAVDDLEAAARLEAFSTPKEYLANALLKAGEEGRARLLLQEILANPAIIWSYADGYWPGMLAHVKQLLK